MNRLMVSMTAICAILPFACVRTTEASVRYTSLLRVGEHVLYDAEAERELCAVCGDTVRVVSL